jgi:two-component system sensor histidine kinase ChvG
MNRLWRAIRLFRPSRIGFRLLAFNLLVLFLPIAAILYLDVYERELLTEQERGMVQEARAVSAALAFSSDLTAEASRLAALLAVQGTSRVRVFDRHETVIADTATQATPSVEPDPYASRDSVRESALYRFGAWLARLPDVVRRSEERSDVMTTPKALLTEVRTALAGGYGAAARRTPGQRSMTLTSAVPIAGAEGVTGAVVVSQTTYRTLSALYRIRFRLFTIIILCLGVAVVLTAIVAATVVRPLARLRDSASGAATRGPLVHEFAGTERHDEIGDLARALHELSRRLDARITQLETFAGDVAHEFRNPLAAIRIAAETIASTNDAAERQRFLARMTADVDRLDRLVGGVRDLATLDAEIAHDRRSVANVGQVVEAVVEGARLTPGPAIVFTTGTGKPARIPANTDRLAQVFENLISNARSFSPAESTVEVSVARQRERITVSVADRGPGIPDAHASRIFERFFTYRPDSASARREHTGLGLAIAKAIVEGYGGWISARNRDGGGAVFTCEWPVQE